jgi:DNA-binding NarL/FixJ family response regulator
VLLVSPASHVIALTPHDEPPYVRGLLDAGARGYVLKRSMIEHLARAIAVVADGGLFLDPTLATRPGQHSLCELAMPSADLRSRQIAVASMTVSAHSNAEIAAGLKIEVKTVETHPTGLMIKLGLRLRSARTLRHLPRLAHELNETARGRTL